MLFSILGTTYGGDGRTTFALPDLRGRVPLHPGSGPRLTPRKLGEKGGEEHVTLTVEQIPAHSHAVNASDAAANLRQPTSALLAQDANYTNTRADTTMSSAMIANTGGSQPHDNMQPYVSINFIIAAVGVFPSRE